MGVEYVAPGVVVHGLVPSDWQVQLDGLAENDPYLITTRLALARELEQCQPTDVTPTDVSVEDRFRS